MMTTPPQNMNRRRFLELTGLGTAALAGGITNVHAEQVKPPTPKRGNVVRLAHFCDIHIQPERGADKGCAAALEHMKKITPSVDLLITGGDTIYDSFHADEYRTELQWKLLRQTFQQYCDVPIRFCMGNHDIWGWHKQDSKTTGNEPLWGKKRALREFDLERPYYSFDLDPWHVIILDSTYPSDKAHSRYIAMLDEAQVAWLTNDLMHVPADHHVMIVSHIPILSIACYEWSSADNEKILIPGGTVHYDGKKLMRLFKDYPQVKLCLAGHQHVVDRVSYNGVTYICDGAVSAAWWGGNHYACEEGFGIVDLYDDGSFDHQYVSYGWKPIA